MQALKQLEHQSIYILREAYANIKNLCMLWSVGKDSTVMLWLARKAFMGQVPFPLIHIDTSFKFPEMISYRNHLVQEWGLDILVGRQEEALRTGQTYPAGNLSRLECCHQLKTEALKQTLDGTAPRMKFNHQRFTYERDHSGKAYQGLIVAIRAEEEGSRSKERYFSPRDSHHQWQVHEQPPEFWNQYQIDCAPDTHLRVHPLLDWTENQIWQYIEQENIPTVSLYYDKGQGQRYRSVGCFPCTSPIHSTARTPRDIIEELDHGALKEVSEHESRSQDKEAGFERLRLEGYI